MHTWSGTGQCPGTELVYVPRELLTQAAEALEDYTGPVPSNYDPDEHETGWNLIIKLRKASNGHP